MGRTHRKLIKKLAVFPKPLVEPLPDLILFCIWASLSYGIFPNNESPLFPSLYITTNVTPHFHSTPIQSVNHHIKSHLPPKFLEMSAAATRGGWAIAASIGAVEALKDQLGVCRWNYVFRCVEQRAKSRVQSYYQKHISPAASSGSGASAGRVRRMMGAEKERIERRERRVKKVMDLSCWGPTTVRF